MSNESARKGEMAAHGRLVAISRNLTRDYGVLSSDFNADRSDSTSRR